MRRLGLFAGAALLFVALTAAFMVLLRPFAGDALDEALPEAAAPPSERPAPPPAAAPKPAPAPAATPFRPDWKGPRVAILVADPGDDAAATKAAADALPFEVGFAFPPGPAPSLAGRERWLSMPMQPKAYPKVNPGPHTLLVGAPAADNLRRLDSALGRGTPVGVTSLMGSAFTVDAPSLAPFMQALKMRGLPFIDARATPASVAAREAARQGVPTATNARFIDAGGDAAAALRALEAEARKQGRAVGFAQPLPATNAAIAAWAKGLESRGVLLVPPGAIVR